MSRREAWLSVAVVFVAAVAVRVWAASLIVFPRPEDAAYYVGVARHLVEGRGLVTDAIWSFQTPPLTFPRPAFEVWLPLPAFLTAIPMLVAGTSFAVGQIASILIGGLVAVLAWRLAADVALERGLSPGRGRVLALGTGLTTAAYLPLVLASVEPDSTIVFAAIVLGACLLISRFVREVAPDLYARSRHTPSGSPSKYVVNGHTNEAPLPAKRAAVTNEAPLPAKPAAVPFPRYLLLLGALIGLAALTRNEAVWLALAWAIVAWGIAKRSEQAISDSGHRRPPGRRQIWFGLVLFPAAVAFAIFAPWAIRDWLTFGTPLPGQAISNALSLQGTDIFAWKDLPTLGRYLGAGPATLVGLRLTGLVHNVLDVLLLLGIPVSAIGLVALPWTARGRTIRALLLFAVITFTATTLLFPVATTWGTFLHAAGAIEVLLIVSAALALDDLVERLRASQGWTRPVAWLGPALMIPAALLFSVALLPAEGAAARATQARYAALPAALAAAGVPLNAQNGPVITDFPIWFAETTGHTAIALPNEGAESILDLAKTFGSSLMVVQDDNGGPWRDAADAGGPGAECFRNVPLPHLLATTDPLKGVLVYSVGCP
jgi:hypothetical protein